MKYTMYSDNGGGLHLIVYGEGGNAVYSLHDMEEMHSETICEMLDYLEAGNNPIEEGWDGNSDNPQADADYLEHWQNDPYMAEKPEIIADENGRYRTSSIAGNIALGID